MPDEANPAETAEETPPKERCGAVKVHGGLTLHCAEMKDHDGAWHKARIVDHREASYGNVHHSIHSVETIRWEPADHIGEATKHMMAGRMDGT